MQQQFGQVGQVIYYSLLISAPPFGFVYITTRGSEGFLYAFVALE